MREDHKEELRLFREIIDIERCFVKQMVQTLQPECLDSLRNINTNTITSEIHIILAHLFTNYGTVIQDTLNKREIATKNV